MAALSLILVPNLFFFPHWIGPGRARPAHRAKALAQAWPSCRVEPTQAQPQSNRAVHGPSHRASGLMVIYRVKKEEEDDNDT